MKHKVCSMLYAVFIGEMMNFETLFPQKLALGSNFCNRVVEREQLSSYVRGARPTLITSPRRYGKTSLCIYVIKQLKMHYAHIDFFPLADISDVQSVILTNIANLIGDVQSVPQKAFNVISDFFSHLNVSLQLVSGKVNVDVIPSKNHTVKTLLEALKEFDKFLVKQNKKVVLFFDEFQRLSQMSHTEIVEGAIRHVAQQSSHVIFVFSGSNRHLLGKMFDDNKRPLYKLCDRIVLDRISESDYAPFIQKKAKKKWGGELADEALRAIFQSTAYHSYYVNVLCARLWRNDVLFNAKKVFEVWHNYALEEKSNVFKELEGLSANQMKLLIALSRSGGTKAPTSDEFLSFVSMPMASVRQSLTALLEKDYVLQLPEKGYRVLDPLIEYILSKRPAYF